MDDPHNLQQFNLDFIKHLLETKENEILDFKRDFYTLNDENEEKRKKARRNLIIDINSLLNVKDRILHNNEESYLIIGIGDENDYYNGYHKNIKVDNKLRQTFHQLIKNHINPHPVITIIDLFISGDKDNIELSFKPKDSFDKIFLIVIKHKIGEVYEIKKNIHDLKEGQTFTRSGADNNLLLENEKIYIRNFKKNPKYQIKFSRIKIVLIVLSILSLFLDCFYIRISFEFNGYPGVLIRYYNIFGDISEEIHISQMNLSNFSDSLKLTETQFIYAIMFLIMISIYIMNIRISMNSYNFPIKKFLDQVSLFTLILIIVVSPVSIYISGLLSYNAIINTPGYTNVELSILPQSSFYILVVISLLSIFDNKTNEKYWNLLYIKNMY